MKKILLTIAYDGTNYFGWQKQLNVVTIEGELYKACNKVFVNGFELIGSSRTDKGVHAIGQRATIQSETSIPIEKVYKALNSNLPKDIVITDAKDVDLSFHPRYDAIEKTYEYKIVNDNFLLPQLRNFVEFEYRPIDIEKIKLASKYFIGEHDFKGFCASECSVKSTVRIINNIEIQKTNSIITMKFTGNGFLYNMVRILSGTLLYVGLGKIDVDSIPNIIKSKDRTKAGKTLSPSGLTLIEIKY